MDHNFWLTTFFTAWVQSSCSLLFIITFAHNLYNQTFGSQLLLTSFPHVFCFIPQLTFKMCVLKSVDNSFVTIVYNSQLLIPSSAELAFLPLDPETHPHVKLYFHSPSPCLIMQMKRLIATVTEFCGEKG